MNKKDKEKLIFETRLKEIQSLDRDTTALIVKLLIGWGTLVLFFYKYNVKSILGIPNNEHYLLWILVLIIWLGEQYNKYITDCYDWLSQTVGKDSLLIESMPQIKWYQCFWYNKKYSQPNKK